MSRSFDLSADYPGTVPQVLAAFADEQYWHARLADSGADEVALDALSVADDGAVTVTTTQVLHADKLPALITQLHRGDLVFNRTEKWTALDSDGISTARVSAQIQGAPATLTGSGDLRPQDSGARIDVRVKVQVQIPLIGGKVEAFIGEQLVPLLAGEQKFTAAWLARGG